MSVRGYLAAIPTAARKNFEKKVFQTYITDALKAIVENTSLRVLPLTGETASVGVQMKERWVNILDPPLKKAPAKDNRSCAEIVDGIWARIRGEK